jgi:hypothetical protein
VYSSRVPLLRKKKGAEYYTPVGVDGDGGRLIQKKNNR